MTHEKALELKVGDRIASPIDNPRYRIRRITRLWVSDDRRRVMVSCTSYNAGAWLYPHAWVKVPTKAIGYDEHLHRFVRTANAGEREKGMEFGERVACRRKLPTPRETIAEGVSYLASLEPAEQIPDPV